MCIIYFMYFLFPSHLKHFLFLGLVVPGPESYPVCHDQLSRMKKQSEGLSSCLQIGVSVRSSVRLCVFLYNVTSKQTKKTNRLTLTNENAFYICICDLFKSYDCYACVVDEKSLFQIKDNKYILSICEKLKVILIHPLI